MLSDIKGPLSRFRERGGNFPRSSVSTVFTLELEPEAFKYSTMVIASATSCLISFVLVMVTGETELSLLGLGGLSPSLSLETLRFVSFFLL